RRRLQRRRLSRSGWLLRLLGNMRMFFHRRLVFGRGKIGRLRTIRFRCRGRRWEGFWKRENDAGDLSLRRRQHGFLLLAGGKSAERDQKKEKRDKGPNSHA